MRSESRRQLNEIESKVINPITNKIAFKNSDKVLEMALDCLWKQLKKQKLLWSHKNLLSSTAVSSIAPHDASDCICILWIWKHTCFALGFSYGRRYAMLERQYTIRMTSINRGYSTLISRSPKRITITIPHYTLEALIKRSDEEGRSMSNLAAFILEQGLNQ